jgi:malate dehydrogenase (oxaloacetate-decarboxylating)
MVARAVAPAFGAFNLEDIASPRCYDVEDRLRSELDIPIFHDDQHGTAIVVTAATLNAAKLTRKRLANMKVVALGVGAAGMACCKMLLKAGVKNLIGFNINGAVHKGRTDLTTQERWLAEHSNPHGFTGSVEEALKGADMVLGLAAAGAIKPHWLKAMKKNAIVFALANPVPEVLPEEAAPYVRIMATGGSNYPNQINNALVFPGFFRGLLDARTTEVTDDMKMEAARQLAAVIPTKELRDDYIIPTVFDPRVATAVADAVKKIAERDRAAATTGGAEPKGMVGCGTAEVMFKASVKKQFGEVDGVVGIEVKKDKIVLRVRDEATKAKLPASFRNRPIEVKVTGNVTKRTPAKK